MQTNKLLLLCLVFVFTVVNICHGSAVIKPSRSIEDTSAAPAAKYLQVKEFLHLSAKEFSAITGKKMNVFDRASFYILKRKVKHDYKRNSDLQLTTYFYNAGKMHLSKGVWIALGILALVLILAAVGLRLN